MSFNSLIHWSILLAVIIIGTFLFINSVKSDDLPSVITDLTIVETSPWGIKLSWTAPALGTSYDLRYATSLITQENWSQATQVIADPIAEPEPAEAGVSQSYKIWPLEPATTYYFAIKSANQLNDWSDLSNVVSVTTLSAPGDDWSSKRHDQHNTAISNDILNPPLKVKWVWNPGGSKLVNIHRYVDIVAKYGRLFFSVDYSTNQKLSSVCLDAFNGEMIWKKKDVLRTRSCLTSVGYKKYLASSNHGLNAVLWALNGQNAKGIGGTGGQYMPADNGWIYFCGATGINSNIAGVRCISPTTQWSHWAFEPSSEDVKWSYWWHSPYFMATLADYLPLCIGSNMVYRTRNCGDLYAFDALTGKIKWTQGKLGIKHQTSYDGPFFLSNPIHLNDKLYIVGKERAGEKWNQYLYTINPLTGDIEKRQYYTTSDALCAWTLFPSTYLIIDNGTAYITDVISSVKSTLIALSLNDGTKKWEFVLPDLDLSWPILSGNTIYMTSLIPKVVYTPGNEISYLHLINKNNGEEVWRFVNPYGNSFRSSIIAYNNLYLLDSKGYVFAFEESADYEALKITTPGPQLASGEVSQMYNQLVRAQGGFSSYQFSIESGQLPPGLELKTNQEAHGLITGYPTSPGQYTFTIKVTDKQGNSASKNFSILVHPGAPTNLQAELLDQEHIKITWQPSSEFGYHVYRAGASFYGGSLSCIAYNYEGIFKYSYTKLTSKPIFDNFYVDTVTKGNYCYYIKAVNSQGGESVFSAPVSISSYLPQPPINLTATPSGLNVNLSWQTSSSENVAGYNAYRGIQYAMLYYCAPVIKLNSEPVSNNFFTDTVAETGKYCYQVSAVDNKGNEGVRSSIINVTVTGAEEPPTPTPLIGDLNNDQKVNSSDFALLIQKWLQTSNITNEDLNNDGKVDTQDLGMIMSHWQE